MKNILVICSRSKRTYSRDCITANTIVETYSKKISMIIQKVFRKHHLSLSEDDLKDKQQHIFLKLFDKNKKSIYCFRLKQYNPKGGASSNGLHSLPLV